MARPPQSLDQINDAHHRRGQQNDRAATNRVRRIGRAGIDGAAVSIDMAAVHARKDKMINMSHLSTFFLRWRVLDPPFARGISVSPLPYRYGTSRLSLGWSAFEIIFAPRSLRRRLGLLGRPLGQLRLERRQRQHQQQQ